MRGSPGANRPEAPAPVLSANRALVPLPVLAIGGIRYQIVERSAGVGVIGQRGAEEDVVGVPPCRVLHEQVGLGDRPRLGIDLLAIQVYLGLGIDGAACGVPILTSANGDVLFGDGQHATRSAAGVIDGTDDAWTADAGFVPGQHEINHQVNDIPGREVLARVLVQRFVESADQLFEDGTHRRVVDLVGVEVHASKPLQHLEQEARLIEPPYGAVEVELLQDLAHVLTEARNMVSQVGGHVGSIGQ